MTDFPLGTIEKSVIFGFPGCYTLGVSGLTQVRQLLQEQFDMGTQCLFTVSNLSVPVLETV